MTRAVDHAQHLESWAKLMASKLESAAAKGRPDWMDTAATSVEALVLHLHAEIQELLSASTPIERMREAADVANVAFMLAEHIGSDAGLHQRALDAARMVRQACP
jgi:hypothetical protein